MAGLSAVARMHDPQAVVWRGDQGLPTAQQGLKVLGAPVGHPDFIRSFLSQKGLEHDHLLEMIPQVPDVQVAWLLLVFCASTRANFPRNHEAATMPLTLGGLGLGNAEDTRRRTLGELGRQFGDDQSPAPRSCQEGEGGGHRVFQVFGISGRFYRTFEDRECQDPKLGGACRWCETRDEEIEGS